MGGRSLRLNASFQAVLDAARRPEHSRAMKAVFDTRPGSGYIDTADSYQFPARYLREATAAIGDWIVFYEPSRGGGRRAYVAAAFLASVRVDPTRTGHHRAHLRDYLPFDQPVSLRGPKGYREERLRHIAESSAVGRALQGRSVRTLTDEDFAAIVEVGLRETLAPENARRLDLADADAGTLDLLHVPMDARVAERVLVNRTVRDASFRRAVLDAYDDTCAVTGLRIVNGGGRAEAQAAHIVPVAEGGLDVVQNGLALSATAHWLFDRHLISIGEDWGLLISHNKVPAALRTLFAAGDNRVRLPSLRALWPHPSFVAQHRERFAGTEIR
jgi:putative restriction endonuclease